MTVSAAFGARAKASVFLFLAGQCSWPWFSFLRVLFCLCDAGSNGSTTVRIGFVGLPDSQVDGLVRLLDDDGDSIASDVSHEQQQLSPGSGSITRDASSGKFFPSSGMYAS